MSSKTYHAWLLRFREYISYRESIWLLAHITGNDHADIITNIDKNVPDDIVPNFELAISKLTEGTPLPYILGSSYFMNRKFFVSTDVMIPRPDTECLVSKILELLGSDTKEKRILDLGTGSGIIAITIKKNFPQHIVWATDYSPGALLIARKNSAFHEADINLSHGNWYEAVVGEKFDYIISNPPYISPHDSHLIDLSHEPKSALVSHDEGFQDLEKIISGANNYLYPEGQLIVEHGWQQGFRCQYAFHENGLTMVSTLKDYLFRDRITTGKSK
ncbi:peptide chain release factor N(5)-glutamine methyltransferase [Candidatus Ichthyocystis sparus]|uniref:peptide chain release factor N(5)-glutamine methyltransferase n=2 Tax=Candidatus Ichthyocystis hellenicum TaxID=1561003 RepID=A0A0S4M4V3_9BURK|nr:peptide chain release factor N(5)-glutamine methyltransferase [Candidatus Ichthyocystis sparus]CUT17754.1 release factor glutamine methyltransferase [Candidatus Ichthyocystis hellenicum]